MYITWMGLNCFKIQSKDVILLTDPYFPKESGLKSPSLKADIVVLSNLNNKYAPVKPLSRSERSEGEVFLISSPGEYETKGIFIYGLPVRQAGTPVASPQDKKIIYRIDLENIVMAYLGELDKALDAEQLEKLNNVDILFVPVGGDGKSALDARKAAEVVNQIEPRIVIPMFYKTPSLKLKLNSVDKFYKEMGVKMESPIDKLKISRKDLPEDETKVILLKA